MNGRVSAGRSKQAAEVRELLQMHWNASSDFGDACDSGGDLNGRKFQQVVVISVGSDDYGRQFGSWSSLDDAIRPGSKHCDHNEITHGTLKVVLQRDANQ